MEVRPPTASSLRWRHPEKGQRDYREQADGDDGRDGSDGYLKLLFRRVVAHRMSRLLANPARSDGLLSLGELFGPPIPAVNQTATSRFCVMRMDVHPAAPTR